MDILIKSPKITRGKGLRSVKEEVNKKEFINDRNAAYTKLFDYYLSEQHQNKILIRKLTNHDYFSNLLRNKKELQYMNMNLLAKVLLFLDSKDDDLFTINPKLEILNYLNKTILKQNKSSIKQINIIDDNKEVLDFFRYIRFVKILMDNIKNNKGEEETRIWSKARNMEMINPHSEDY